MVGIKDMNMPKNCWQCRFGVYNYSLNDFECVAIDYGQPLNDMLDIRPEFCPLIEIITEREP